MEHKIECLEPQVIGGTCTCDPPVVNYVTISDMAERILGRVPQTMADFDEAGLPMMGGCQACEATVACYNSCPSKTGYLRCGDGCIEGLGWTDVDEAISAIFSVEV